MILLRVQLSSNYFMSKVNKKNAVLPRSVKSLGVNGMNVDVLRMKRQRWRTGVRLHLMTFDKRLTLYS